MLGVGNGSKVELEGARCGDSPELAQLLLAAVHGVKLPLGGHHHKVLHPQNVLRRSYDVTGVRELVTWVWNTGASWSDGGCRGRGGREWRALDQSKCTL